MEFYQFPFADIKGMPSFLLEAIQKWSLRQFKTHGRFATPIAITTEPLDPSWAESKKTLNFVQKVATELTLPLTFDVIKTETHVVNIGFKDDYDLARIQAKKDLNVIKIPSDFRIKKSESSKGKVEVVYNHTSEISDVHGNFHVSVLYGEDNKTVTHLWCDFTREGEPEVWDNDKWIVTRLFPILKVAVEYDDMEPILANADRLKLDTGDLSFLHDNLETVYGLLEKAQELRFFDHVFVSTPTTS